MNKLNNFELVDDIVSLIRSSKQRTAATVNAELTLLYWHIGNRINQYLLQGERAEYGQEIVRTLAEKLTAQFGKGWGKRHLNYVMQFASTFPNIDIVYALRAQLSWSHFKQLVHIPDHIKRDFYATMAAQER